MNGASRREVRAARQAKDAGTRRRGLLSQTMLLNALFAVGALAVWPIYRSTGFIVAVVVGVAVAHLVAFAGMRWRWSGWWVALAALGGYLVVGLPVAAPGGLGSVPGAARAFVGVLTAPVTGWKDLLTLELPLGTYQTTLAPALLLFIAVPTAALSLAWRSQRWWIAAAPTGLLLSVFGVVFGARELAPAVTLGPLTVPREALIGVAALVVAIAVGVGRTRADRRRALATAVAASGVRSSGATGRGVAGRGVAGRGVAGRAAVAGSMVLVAVVAAAAWAPWALAGAPREVARSGVDPVVEIARTLSPLAQYRASFTDDTAYGEALFTIAAPAEVERIRLATLPFFDGRTARAVDPTTGDEDPATAFIRVPSAIDQGAGAIADVAVTIGALEGIWLPTAGSLAEITFEGPRAADLADGFFHNTATGAAVQLAEPGLSDGDAYRLRVAAPETGAAEAGADVASLTPLRNGPSLDDAIVPESLREWIDAQAAPAGGAGLAELIDRLRARGYLSHALAVDTADPPTWLSDLGAPDFQPSRAGHSTDRIGDLFDQLLDRQVELGDAPDPQLVAGVGDDEQFAVAAAMIADQLGFDTRIVVGTRLASAEDLPVCDDDGTCRGGDLAAWIEVRGAEGRWVAIDVTPQHEVFPSPDLEQRQDPKNPTHVRDDAAEEVLPPEANPAEGTARDEDVAEETTDLSALWSALRVAGISLSALVLLIGPLLVIVLVKAVRRRARRRSPDVVTRFTGGWEEFVDTAVDHGYPVPAAHTRQELATLYAGGDPSSPRRMATWADRSVFDVAPPTEAENAEFWRLVDAERARLAGEGTFWSRLRARVSLRSLRARPQRPARR